MDYKDFSLQYFLDTEAARYRRRGFKVHYEPFVYGADFLPISTSANPALVQIDGDSDFIVAYRSFACFTVGGVNTPAPNILVSLSDQTSQRDLQSQAPHILNTFGNGELPFVLLMPLHLTARTTLAVTIANISGVDQNLRLSFVGVKAFTTRL